MGERLVRFYSLVSQQYGLAGKVKLAQETKVPSTHAAIEPDTPENIKRFEEAVEKIAEEAPTPV